MTHVQSLAGRVARPRVLAPLVFAATITACDTDRLTHSSGDPATPPTAEISAVSTAAFGASFRGGIPFGTYAMPTSEFGDLYNGALRNIWPKFLLGELSIIKGRGGKVVLMFAGNEEHYKDANGHFDMGKWKARIDRFKGVDFSSFINDGTIIGHYLIDEPYDPFNWNGKPVPGSVVEEMAKYSKQLWPTMTTIVRAQPDQVKWNGTFRYLDAAWAQYTNRKGDIQEYIRRHVADAQTMGLGLIVGLNITKGNTKNTKMTASQVEEWGSALLSSSYACAFISWQYDAPYLRQSDIQAAMTRLAGLAQQRPTRSCQGSSDDHPDDGEEDGEGRGDDEEDDEDDDHPDDDEPESPPPPLNQAPVADFTGPNCTAGAPCRFTDRSSDSDGTLASRSWDFGDGGSSDDQDPSHTYAAAGAYTVTLTVVDDDGASRSVSARVTVSPVPNQAPTAVFDPPTCTAGAPCRFIDGSQDEDGRIVSRSWNFGTGTSVAAEPTTTFTEAGSYPVALTVTDDRGGVGTVTHMIVVRTAVLPGSSQIALSTSVITRNGRQEVRLVWSGARGSTVELYRDGARRERLVNDGRAVRPPWHWGQITMRYQICETGGARCSNPMEAQVGQVPLRLNLSGSVRGGRQYVLLTWSGATGSAVEIYRDGNLLRLTGNDGRHTIVRQYNRRITYQYRVCEQGGGRCSATQNVSFR